MALDLILVRHGQSQYNVDQTGGEDAPLTELGRMQARRVGTYLARRFEIQALYASTYVRAHETAEIVNSFLGLELVLDPDLRESQQDFAGRIKFFPHPSASFEPHTARRPNEVSEYYAGYQARVAGAVRRILGNHDSGQIAIVSHGGTMATIMRSLTSCHEFSCHTENTGIHLLRWENNRWHLVATNRVEHLLGEQDLVTIPATHEHKRE